MQFALLLDIMRVAYIGQSGNSHLQNGPVIVEIPMHCKTWSYAS